MREDALLFKLTPYLSPCEQIAKIHRAPLQIVCIMHEQNVKRRPDCALPAS